MRHGSCGMSVSWTSYQIVNAFIKFLNVTICRKLPRQRYVETNSAAPKNSHGTGCRNVRFFWPMCVNAYDGTLVKRCCQQAIWIAGFRKCDTIENQPRYHRVMASDYASLCMGLPRHCNQRSCTCLQHDYNPAQTNIFAGTQTQCYKNALYM